MSNNSLIPDLKLTITVDGTFNSRVLHETFSEDESEAMPASPPVTADGREIRLIKDPRPGQDIKDTFEPLGVNAPNFHMDMQVGRWFGNWRVGGKLFALAGPKALPFHVREVAAYPHHDKMWLDIPTSLFEVTRSWVNLQLGRKITPFSAMYTDTAQNDTITYSYPWLFQPWTRSGAFLVFGNPNQKPEDRTFSLELALTFGGDEYVNPKGRPSGGASLWYKAGSFFEFTVSGMAGPQTLAADPIDDRIRRVRILGDLIVASQPVDWFKVILNGACILTNHMVFGNEAWRSMCGATADVIFLLPVPKVPIKIIGRLDFMGKSLDADLQESYLDASVALRFDLPQGWQLRTQYVGKILSNENRNPWMNHQAYLGVVYSWSDKWNFW